ncbi:MAG: VTT domain-containing protein [Synergistaceae bacterium]|nr:VTT domain-containing protein [Synergistaceae bacterium]
MAKISGRQIFSGFSALKFFLTLAAIGFFAAVRFLHLQDNFQEFYLALDTLGPVGGLIFIVLYVIATLFMLPTFFLAIGAGVLFGLVQGIFIVSLASTAGAAASFLAARHLFRNALVSRFGSNRLYKAINGAVACDQWKIVLLTRLSPLFPFNILNYLFGLTGLPFSKYIFASWVGMIPVTVAYVYLGTLGADIALIGPCITCHTPLEWTLIAAGFLVTGIVTILITRTTKKILNSGEACAYSEES